MDLNVCRTCLSRRSSSTRLNLFDMFHEMAENIRFITNIEILENQFSMCNDCVREIAVAMNFRRKAIEANNIILGSSVSVLIVKPEIDDYPPIVTTFDFPCGDPSIEDVKHIAKIESNSSDDEPASPPPVRVRVKKTVKKEDTLNIEKGSSAEPKKRRPRGPYKRKLKEKEQSNNEYPCEVCGKVFRRAGHVTGHMKFVHTVMTIDDYYFCDLCPRKFKTKGACSWHIQQRHILNTSFTCVECEVTFKTKWQLKCHNKTKHLKVFDSQCVICGKAFANKQKLEVHMRIHTGERNYKCHICTKTYIHKTDLRRHVWGHTNYRPYVCEFPGCNKGFMKNSELKNHQGKFGHFYESESRIAEAAKLANSGLGLGN